MQKDDKHGSQKSFKVCKLSEKYGQTQAHDIEYGPIQIWADTDMYPEYRIIFWANLFDGDLYFADTIRLILPVVYVQDC